MNLGRQTLEAVGDLEPTGDDPDGEFAQGAFAILTAALGKLPEARREALLAKIEDGDLRRAVEDYMARYAALQAMRQRQSLYPRAGNGQAH